MFDPFSCLCMTNQGCAQAGDIERRGVITGAIPATGRIGTTQPGTPFRDRVAVLRGGVGLCGVSAAWTDMRRLPGLVQLLAPYYDEMLEPSTTSCRAGQ